ncbi:hypothetical protein FQN57_002202 [Myotisia sp. PD_48]|nr:hypothetical protein FQN57_002202 [Myotisia sp. PD_48]
MPNDGTTTAPESLAATMEKPDESSKLRSFVVILRKFIGVPDIATARFSLPAQLLEPIPNLEFWNYLDRPESFISIGKSDDELGRMFEVLRFWFTKDLKYVKGKPCKPYNSVLGEFFRCNWEIEDVDQPILGTRRGSLSTTEAKEKVKVSYLTEQTSHHPPVSAFYVDCPARGISARGFDQISAKFTGTGVRISPGHHNLGIFVNLSRWDNEEYQLTHPAAHVGGLLRGTLSVTVSDTCYITCPKTRIKAILQYHENGWLGKPHHKVSGIIFRYDPEDDTITKSKDVPDDDILAEIQGCWHGQIYYTLRGSSEQELLIDVTPLFPGEKCVPPPEQQLYYESRRLWSDITEAIHSRQYPLATHLKHELEESQRQKAAIRMEKCEKWKPRFFTVPINPSGKPELTDEGKEALAKLNRNDFELEEAVNPEDLEDKIN